MKLIILLLLTLTLLYSCKEKQAKTVSYDSQESNSIDDKFALGEEGYSDGEYCADVEYYNPNTGTDNTYTLTVEVQDGLLTVIHWPNGGWLDESHFSAPEVDENGEASFTSDKGYDYTISIQEEGSCN